MPEIPEGSSALPEERFARLCDELISRPDVARGVGKKHGFGSTALTTRDKIFAMLVSGRLVVKLPKRRVDELTAAGDGEPLTMGNRRMREWLSLSPDSSLDWRALAEEARELIVTQSE